MTKLERNKECPVCSARYYITSGLDPSALFLCTNCGGVLKVSELIRVESKNATK